MNLIKAGSVAGVAATAIAIVAYRVAQPAAVTGGAALTVSPATGHTFHIPGGSTIYDLNMDGAVNDLDAEVMRFCHTRATVKYFDWRCQWCDFDHDYDVDQEDFGVWQRRGQ